jgi:hypothetical protein
MHLVPGIVATSQGGGVVQATKSQCGPLLNIAPITAALRGLGTDFNRAWAETCVEFNQSVLDYLAATPSIDLVVLSSVFRQYLDGSEFLSLVRENQRFHVAPANADTAMAGLEQTVNAIRALGKRVIVVAPPPPGQFNIGACLERLADGKVLFGAPRDCRVPQAQYQEESAKVLHLLSQVPGKLDVAIFSFEPLLCIGGLCQTSIDGTFVYRDALHFSYDGSRLLAERADLARKLREMAR